ncbi:hypothetical protein [Granulosicoccus antarcticus]|uniref:Uncharacterized protein n=1 Tax=Granulosicoccus antarcticus IMCC3135 TaxID=1192854 RepID=A0A2Z2NSS0_9GAMM|nr:hypothetical protein [Granulosicoccus antarcticus]ASJ74562.1 hypothetical protein IMCC3135_22460 [Granulosicoccus antarcticus IMCC3135]
MITIQTRFHSRPRWWAIFKVLIASAFFITADNTLAQDQASTVVPHDSWMQLVIPADTAGQTVEQLFADDLDADSYNQDGGWVVFTYDPTENVYDNPGLSGTIPPGTGFWMLQVTGVEVSIDVPLSLPTPTITTSLPCIAAGGCFAKTLLSGPSVTSWNLLGSPFKRFQPLAGLLVGNETAGGPCFEGCSLQEAETENLSSAALWHYDSEKESYVEYDQSSGLVPWRGFWMAALEGSSTGTTRLYFQNVIDLYQLVASPTDFLTNTQTEVRFQMRLLPGAELPGNVAQLFRTTDGVPFGQALCTLKDDGALDNGDDLAGDKVYSCLSPFIESSESTVNLVVSAEIDGNFSPVASIDLNAIDPITDEEASIVISAQSSAQQIWKTELAQVGDTVAARETASEIIANLPGVLDSGVAEDDTTIWITYESGLTTGLMLNPEGTRGSQEDRDFYSTTVNVETISPAVFDRLDPHGELTQGPLDVYAEETGEKVVGSSRVLIWDAYNSQFAPFDEGPDLRTLFEGTQCPLFDVNYLIDSQATVDSVRQFNKYGTIILITHGAVDKDGQVVFLTRENTGVFSIIGHSIDLLLGRISIMGDVYAIRPSFITSLPGNSPGAIIYNGSCSSSANSSMADAFVSEGASSYYGYTRTVNSPYAQNAANQLFDNLVKSLDTTGDAFAPVTPKIDPVTPFATFTLTSDPTTSYTGELTNGEFETGDLTGWTTEGDGRSIVNLGEFSPPGGNFMGIISTGLGFTTSSGSLAQNFCLAADATELTFDWNFNSEEFVEWCGPEHPFDDPFTVEMLTDSGTELLLSETIDTLCSTVTANSLAFDVSGPACEVSEGVGFGTGGNDCTVYGTGNLIQTIDITAIAANNVGKGVTLRFRNFDEGDSQYDSAVLIDNVKIR